MAGAKSLIELILKKWGDDAAGAAKELEDKIGFPESVANRIATGELPVAAGLLAAGQSDESEAGPLAKFISKTVSRQDDVDLPWSSEATYTHDPSGGFMKLGIYPDGRASTLELEVPEEFRRGGIGSELQESALLDYPEMQGQVSSKSALKNAYRLGRRPVEEPEATLERALEMQREASSVNMRRPTERGNADPRLLAGIAGTTAAGLAAPMVKDSGMISSPRSETLFDLTMGARDVERRLEGSLGSLLFPSGLVDYLEAVNRREEDPNAMTRGMALLDVLPF